MTGRPAPQRTCVGCRRRAAKSDLLRIVVVEEGGLSAAVPDLRGRLPGRGASLHPDLGCLDLAERRRAFPRAFRLSGPLDISAVRQVIRDQVETSRQARIPFVPSEAGREAMSAR